jgi:hypothetical protein
VQPVVQNVAAVTHICYVMVACATCFDYHWSSSMTVFIEMDLILEKNIDVSCACDYIAATICVNGYAFIV